MWLTLALAIFVAFPLAGVLLLILGLRGPRLDTLPRCSRCRFETTGLAAAAPCPECGADLSRPKAITIGRRRKRPLAIALGTLLLLVSIAIFATAAAIGVNNPANNPSKPNWLLQLETHRTDARLAAAAITELTARVGTPAMSSDVAKSLLNRALAVQADQSTVWLPAWGDLVVACRQAGLCDPESYTNFVKRGVSIRTLPVRKVMVGHPFERSLEVKAPRLGTSAVPLRIDVSVTLGGIQHPWSFPSGDDYAIAYGETFTRYLFTDPAINSGTTELQQSIYVSVVDKPGSSAESSIGAWKMELKDTLTVYPYVLSTEKKSTPTSELVQSWFKVSQLSISTEKDCDNYLYFQLSPTKIPSGLFVGRISIVWSLNDGQEDTIECGHLIISSKPGWPTYYGCLELNQEQSPTNVRIVLTPSPLSEVDPSLAGLVYQGPDIVIQTDDFQDHRKQLLRP